MTADSTEATLIERAQIEERAALHRLVQWATRFGPSVVGRDVIDVVIERYERLESALTPFAARVHLDGVDAPYPEDEWGPILQAAKEALDAR